MQKGQTPNGRPERMLSRPVRGRFFLCNTFFSFLHYIYEHVYEKEFRRAGFRGEDSYSKGSERAVEYGTTGGASPD